MDNYIIMWGRTYKELIALGVAEYHVRQVLKKQFINLLEKEVARILYIDSPVTVDFSGWFKEIEIQLQ